LWQEKQKFGQEKIFTLLFSNITKTTEMEKKAALQSSCLALCVSQHTSINRYTMHLKFIPVNLFPKNKAPHPLGKNPEKGRGGFPR